MEGSQALWLKVGRSGEAELYPVRSFKAHLQEDPLRPWSGFPLKINKPDSSLLLRTDICWYLPFISQYQGGSKGKVWSRKWQPTPVFLPGKPKDRGAWQTTVHGDAKSQTQLSTHILKGKVGSSWNDLDTHQAPRRMTERELVLGPTSSTHWLCDLEQVTSSLWALASSSVKWDNTNTYSVCLKE